MWGSDDPHIPAEGRAKVEAGLEAAGVQFEKQLHAAEHAFMRDVGPRFDPEATDPAFAAMVRFCRATF